MFHATARSSCALYTHARISDGAVCVLRICSAHLGADGIRVTALHCVALYVQYRQLQQVCYNIAQYSTVQYSSNKTSPMDQRKIRAAHLTFTAICHALSYLPTPRIPTPPPTPGIARYALTLHEFAPFAVCSILTVIGAVLIGLLMGGQQTLDATSREGEEDKKGK